MTDPQTPADDAEREALTRFVVRSSFGYYLDEESGAYLWVRARKHALRMTKTEADNIASYPSLMSVETRVEPV